VPDGKPSDELEEIRKDRFPTLTRGGDTSLRLVAWLIHNKDFRQLEERTGISSPRPQPSKPENFLLAMLRRLIAWMFGTRKASIEHFLPVLLRLDVPRIKPELFSESFRKRYGIPLAYRAERERNKDLAHITGHLPLEDEIFRGSTDSLVNAVEELRENGVERVCLGVPGQPSRERELVDIGLPDNRKYNGKKLTGKGVVVGIIDDGCAFAHRDFLKKTPPGAPLKSRLLCLWDQAGTGNPAAGWQAPTGFSYGLVLNRKKIEDAIHANQDGDLVREDAVYRKVGYRIGEVATHGTHVMDIAAGTGRSLMGIEGIAPGADIIFVQLPPPAIEGGAKALWKHIEDGVTYVFQRAEALNPPRPAVVNISYGGYDGPHDGTSELEKALDRLLETPDRAIVLAAGNGFEARCHAAKTVKKNKGKSLRWIVNPCDPTANDLEAWYDDKCKLVVRLQSPDIGIDPAGWVKLGQARMPITRTTDGKTIGYIEHLAGTTGNRGNQIVISLNATDMETETATTAPAPSGMWTVDFKHDPTDTGPDAGANTKVHAWIWRDDAGSARNARLRQSRFRPDDAHPAHSIAGWATGHRTISVGAYNIATGEICSYSASGPTRPVHGTGEREKPEIYAPAEEDVRGRGILSASALSARPSRMNGTSAAAPHVTGLIALMFEYAHKHATPPQGLTADQIAQELKAEAKKNELRLNRHQKVDDRVPVKQKNVLAKLVPTGKTDFTETMEKLPQ
jgi:subtilisin family serine protease